jgi:4-hydroxy-tetrahydrodipicolinate synthase
MEMNEPTLRGLMPAFPTPVHADATIDTAALARLVEYQIAGGVAGLVPLGGTGEAPALTADSRRRVVEATVAAAARRVPVVAGVLDAGLGGAIDTARLYEAAGADALMVIPPYYSRTDQDGLLRYFRAVRRETRLPIVLYDNPYRSNIVIAPTTIAKMAEERLIVGMKASSTDLYHFDRVAQLVGEDFGLLSGQDTLFVQQVLSGAKGGVLTSAALVPGHWRETQALVEAGRAAEALARQRALGPFMDALFAEQFPAAVRSAFAMIGLPIGPALPPTGKLSRDGEERLERAVAELLEKGVLLRA